MATDTLQKTNIRTMKKDIQRLRKAGAGNEERGQIVKNTNSIGIGLSVKEPAHNAFSATATDGKTREKPSFTKEPVMPINKGPAPEKEKIPQQEIGAREPSPEKESAPSRYNPVSPMKTVPSAPHTFAKDLGQNAQQERSKPPEEKEVKDWNIPKQPKISYPEFPKQPWSAKNQGEEGNSGAKGKESVLPQTQNKLGKKFMEDVEDWAEKQRT